MWPVQRYQDSLGCPVAILCNQAVASVLSHLPPTIVLAASIQILCNNTCAQKPPQSLLKNKSKTKQKNGIIYIYTSYMARTQKIEEIVTLNTLTSNGYWCMGIKGEMSGTVCVTLHEICIYLWVVYSLCFFCCLFITVTWWYVWCFEWASGNQEEVQACLVTLWLFIISCYSLYKTTLGLLCSWFKNNPHFHKYSMDFRV